MRYRERIPKETNEFHPEMTSDKYPGYLGRYDDLLENRGFAETEWNPYIMTAEGELKVSEGDWIITGVKGERYPCKPDIFAMTYEAVTEEGEQDQKVFVPVKVEVFEGQLLSNMPPDGKDVIWQQSDGDYCQGHYEGETGIVYLLCDDKSREGFSLEDFTHWLKEVNLSKLLHPKQP